MKSFKFTIKGHDYEVYIRKFVGDFARIEVNGTQYDIELHKKARTSKTPQLVRKPIETPKDAHVIKKDADAATSKIKAPLPGTILQVFVDKGDAVKKGNKLLIYEAMKMENEVLAEKDGTVKSIKVAPGDNVLQDDVLIELA